MSNVSMINGHIDEPKCLTDEQIVKALECCDIMYNCPDCPFECDCGGLENLFTATIDLLKRKDEQINALIAGQESLMKCIAKKKETIAELDAEVERLKKENNLYSDLAKMGDALKDEAIKGFAARLKNRSEDTTDWGQPYVLCKDIDDLVEEMTVSVSDSKEFWEDTN